MSALTARLLAKAAMTPAQGFNLVGVDDFEDPGEELYLIAGPFETRGEAEVAQRRRATSNPHETLHIYGRDKVKKSMDAIDTLESLSKGFPPGKSNQDESPTNKPGKPSPGDRAQGGTAGQGKGPQGQAGDPNGAPQKPATPGQGKPGAPAQAKDQTAGTVQYPTKVQDPESGEFTFVYQDDKERDPESRFVVSDETAEGAHWEVPQHGEHYDAFKQWKAARKKGLAGSQIPQELVAGALKHAEKHHYDGGPHKAAYDDHLAHQGGEDAPQPPPTHHTQKQPGAGAKSHPSMQSKDGDEKPSDGAQKPPAKPAQAQGSTGNSGQGTAQADDKQKAKQLAGKLIDVVWGGTPSGTSRNGMEHRTAGPSIEEAEEDYQELYGRLARSEDALGVLGDLSKATGKVDRWITVNGTHIPIGSDGQMQGPVADKIRKDSKKAKKKPAGKHHEVEAYVKHRYRGSSVFTVKDPSAPGGSSLHEYEGKGATAAERKEHALKQHQKKHGIDKPLKSVNFRKREREAANKDVSQGAGKRIKIATVSGNETSVAHHRQGVYAAHPQKGSPGKYAVTHVPSGQSIQFGIPKEESGWLVDHLHSKAPDAMSDLKFGKKPGNRHKEDLQKLHTAIKEYREGSATKGSEVRGSIDSWQHPDSKTEKSFAGEDPIDALSKAYDPQPLPEQYLYEYLVGKICDAGAVPATDYEGDLASSVMVWLVNRMRSDGDLRRACLKYKVTTASVKEILRSKGLLDAKTQDYYSNDWDSVSAMSTKSANGPTGEVMMASDARYNFAPEPDEKRDLQLHKSEDLVTFDSAGLPRGVVRRPTLSQMNLQYRDSMVKANRDSSCLIHGDIHKQQIGHQPYIKCSCPG